MKTELVPNLHGELRLVLSDFDDADRVALKSTRALLFVAEVSFNGQLDSLTFEISTQPAAKPPRRRKDR